MLPLAGLLAIAVGLPFFVLASTAPLLMRWFAAVSRSGQDPYPLYAASNAGSLVGLLAYPLLVEPLLPLDRQQLWWAAAASAAFALVAACATVASSRGQESGVRGQESGKSDASSPSPTICVTRLQGC